MTNTEMLKRLLILRSSIRRAGAKGLTQATINPDLIMESNMISSILYSIPSGTNHRSSDYSIQYI